jgi:hypothetical protein
MLLLARDSRDRGAQERTLVWGGARNCLSALPRKTLAITVKIRSHVEGRQHPRPKRLLTRRSALNAIAKP